MKKDLELLRPPGDHRVPGVGLGSGSREMEVGDGVLIKPFPKCIFQSGLHAERRGLLNISDDHQKRNIGYDNRQLQEPVL